MLDKKLVDSIEIIDKELKIIEERREYLIKENRNVIILCSKAIVDLHQDKINESEKKLDNAQTVLAELKKYSKTDLERIIFTAEQEYVEALMLKAIKTDKEIPSIDEMCASNSAYLNGILDCIGEVKRLIYDKMREGDFDCSMKLFEKVQEIYNLVYPFAIYDNIISGLRRKLDIGRMMIEDIRELITEETRRRMLINKIDAFEPKSTIL